MATDALTTMKTNLESELLLLWNRFLNRTDLTIDDDFFESGGDSLLAVELLIEVDRLTQATIPPSILFETGSVRRLAERLDQRETLRPQPAVRIGGNSGRLLHFFHGDFDTGGLSVPKLAALLGRNQPILAIAPHGMGGEPVPASIEEMAADRLPVVLAAQPSGPYALGGHCNGALVAFETARLLVNAGHRVDLVILIDPIVVSLKLSSRLALLALDLKNRAMRAAPELRRKSRQLAWLRLARIDEEIRLGIKPRSLWMDTLRAGVAKISRLSGYSNDPKMSTISNTSPQIPADSELMHVYSQAMSIYHPSPLAVPILYIALSYSGDRWSYVSSDFELINIPGDHFGFAGKAATTIMGRVQRRIYALEPV